MRQSQTQQKSAVIRNQARIIDLLGWTLAKYSAFMYNCGLVYLEKYIGNDEEAINMLTPRAVFWEWWKNLFNARDEAFIEEWDGMEDSIEREDLRKLYSGIHNPAILSAEIHPPKIVYGEKFTSIQMANA